MIEQSSLKVGALPEYWFIIPWLCAFGAGILSVIALWNLRRLGSTVTIGDTATPRPNSFAVKSGSIGWAYIYMHMKTEKEGVVVFVFLCRLELTYFNFDNYVSRNFFTSLQFANDFAYLNFFFFLFIFLVLYHISPKQWN